MMLLVMCASISLFGLNETFVWGRGGGELDILVSFGCHLIPVNVLEMTFPLLFSCPVLVVMVNISFGWCIGVLFLPWCRGIRFLTSHLVIHSWSSPPNFDVQVDVPLEVVHLTDEYWNNVVCAIYWPLILLAMIFFIFIGYLTLVLVWLVNFYLSSSFDCYRIVN